MNSQQPIKRSKELAPLSREHHDSLLFTWKIKQGVKLATPDVEIKAYIKWYWANYLVHHFQAEENLLLPQLPAGDRLGQQLLDEHAAIRRDIGNANDAAAFVSLADQVNAHIRFEERELFPHIEKLLSATQLEKIYSSLESEPHCSAQWPNEFWLPKK